MKERETRAITLASRLPPNSDLYSFHVDSRRNPPSLQEIHMPQYAIDYDDNETDRPTPLAPGNDNLPAQYRHSRYEPRREKRFRMPSIVRTAALFLTGAATLFAWESYAPEAYRFTTLWGTGEARIAAAVKAAELQQQVGFEAYVAQVKLAADQQAEQYKAVTQGVLANYNANYEMTKITTQAYMQVQGRYADTLMNQKTMQQGADTGIINVARGFGRIMNVLQPGSGDDALNYANNLGGTLADEVTAAARKGTGTPIFENWQSRIASPAEVAATLASIKPFQLPPLPAIGEMRPKMAVTYSPAR
jgi:hypothetical protein